MAAVPDRVRWAVEVIAPRQDDRILELGCGPGVAAALVCERLTTGHLLAVDRSPVAVGRTSQRNAVHVAAGRLTVRQTTVADLTAGAVGDLDRAFAINVNVFWTGDAGRELAALHRVLRPGGELFVLYGTGPAGSRPVTPAVAKTLAANGFTGLTILETTSGSGVRGIRSP